MNIDIKEKDVKDIVKDNLKQKNIDYKEWEKKKVTEVKLAIIEGDKDWEKEILANIYRKEFLDILPNAFIKKLNDNNRNEHNASREIQ